MEEIKELVNQCLNCKTSPCKNTGCPLENNIPEFIRLIKEEKYEEAYRVLSETTVLESICGRICPHLRQCMGSCVKGIKGHPVEIGKLEAWLGDMALENDYKMDDNIKPIEKSGRKVAIIGSGPAGLTCAAFLARHGYEVTIIEKNKKLGGLLRYGIPEFRLSKEILDKAINKILSLGIKVELNKQLGKDITLDDIRKVYDAVFISIGANVPWSMGISGENLKGVYGGNSLLENNNHPEYKNKTVAIIGGGNVAIDCARTIKRMGARKVVIIYRRDKEQMPADIKEIEEAENEGIEFLYKTNIVRVIGNKYVQAIECIETELVKKEGDSRLSPVNIVGSNFVIDIDYVVTAIGSMPQKEIVESLGVETNKYGYINVDDNYETSIKYVFAGGDIAGNKATVAWAARAGREAAMSIIEKFK